MFVLPSLKGIGKPQTAATIDLGNYITWTGKTNVTESTGSKLTKTSGTGGSWDAGAYSTQEAASGKICVSSVMDELVKIDMIGISNASDAAADASYSNIDFAFYPFSNNLIYYCENGSVGIIGDYQVGDTLYVRINALGKVEYGQVRAGVTTVLRTINTPTLNYPLRADCSMQKANSTLAECKIKIG